MCPHHRYEADCKVIYGDTDSVMVNFRASVCVTMRVTQLCILVPCIYFAPAAQE
jgi:hypothetical protein